MITVGKIRDLRFSRFQRQQQDAKNSPRQSRCPHPLPISPPQNFAAEVFPAANPTLRLAWVP